MSRYLPDHYKVADTQKGKVPSRVKRAFGSRKICYVLISCEEPNSRGEMEVEMTYDGDKYLASYLVQSAMQLLEEQM